MCEAVLPILKVRKLELGENGLLKTIQLIRGLVGISEPVQLIPLPTFALRIS